MHEQDITILQLVIHTAARATISSISIYRNDEYDRELVNYSTVNMCSSMHLISSGFLYVIVAQISL